MSYATPDWRVLTATPARKATGRFGRKGSADSSGGGHTGTGLPTDLALQVNEVGGSGVALDVLVRSEARRRICT